MRKLFRISKKTLKTARTRFFQLVFLSMILSAFSMMFTLSSGSSQGKVLVITSFCMILFMIINGVIMRDTFYVLLSKRRYFKANFLAYFGYILLSVIVYFINNTVGYTWIFMITKVMVYTTLGWPTWMSALVFHLFMIATIFLSPLGMYTDS